MKKLRVIEAFAGIGAYSKALKNLGINHEVMAAIEFDKKTVDCYNVIHNTSFVNSDITKINAEELPECDLFCYSPPCQSFSVAGKGEGVDDVRGTLFWDALKIIEAKKPRYCVMENVKNLTGKKHRPAFDAMLSALSDAGYVNHWKVLNSKEYGVPQNRERVFVVSARKDLAVTDFEFPAAYDSGVRLRDILEPVVDEKYYIDDAKCAKLIEELSLKHGDCINPQGRLGKKLIPKDCSPTLRAQTHGNLPQVVVDPQVLRPQRTDYGKAIRKQYEAGEVQESRHNMTVLVPRTDGISNTVTTVTKDNLVLLNEPIAIIDDLYAGREARVYTEIAPTLRSERHGLKVACVGNVNPCGHGQNGNVYSEEGLAPTVTTNKGEGAKILVREVCDTCEYMDYKDMCGDCKGLEEYSEHCIDMLGLLDIKGNQQIRRVYSVDGVAPTLSTMQGGNQQPKVLVENPPMRWRIRKLTPLECLRLQSFDDSDHAALVSAGISNSQMYRIAGNSITVTVLEGIFKALLCPTTTHYDTQN